MESEKRATTQSKEIQTLKAKGQEDKDQLTGEARAHEKAKQQLEKLVSQLQDTERSLKGKLREAKQEQVEHEI